MISYEKLWKTMKKKKITQYSLIMDYGMSRGQIYRLKRNDVVTTNTLDILCNILSCDIGDIVEHIHDNNNRFRPE